MQMPDGSGVGSRRVLEPGGGRSRGVRTRIEEEQMAQGTGAMVDGHGVRVLRR